MTTTHTAAGPIGSATLTEFIAGLRGRDRAAPG